MASHPRLVAAITIVAALAAIHVSNAQSGHELFQQALSRERSDGDLGAAIRAYIQVVEVAAGDRALAARALHELARCYEILGRADAVSVYERIVDEYAEQSAAVTRARGRLAALRPSSVAAEAAVLRPLPRIDAANDLRGLAPDGSKAAYVDYSEGQNLGVYDFVTQRTMLLTRFTWTLSPPQIDTAGTAYWVDHAVWSADGRTLAYSRSSWRTDAIWELCVVGLDGRSRVIYRNEANPGRMVRPASWLPDGRAILAVIEAADGTAAIGLIPSAGGTFTPLRSLRWAGGIDLPKISPDGRFVAFAESTGDTRDIRIVSVDGSSGMAVAAHPSDDRQPVWAPDGRHVAFISNRGGVTALWAIAMRNGRPDGQPFHVRDGMQEVVLHGWTARGLAFVQHARTDDILLAAVTAGEGATQPPKQLEYPRSGRNTSPAWSPDGKHVAFVWSGSADPNRRYVVVLPPSGGAAREFLIPTTQYDAPFSPYDLRWFGDGSGIGFSGLDAKRAPTMFRLNLATGEWQNTPLPIATWTRSEWNRDGTTFFYARQGFGAGPSRIIERDFVTGRERTLFESRVSGMSAIRGLRVSPDRQRLAFVSTTGTSDRATTSVMVVDLAGGAARTLLSHESGVTPETAVALGTPDWTSDSATVIVTRGRDQNYQLLALAAGGDAAARVLPSGCIPRSRRGNTGSSALLRDVVLSPDGSTLACAVSSARTDGWLLEKPLSGLTPSPALPR